MANKYGLKTVAYYGAAGAEATTELTGIIEDNLDHSGTEVEVTTKGTGVKSKQYDVVNHDLPVGWTLLWDGANAGHAAVMAAWQGKTKISLLFLDGAKNVAGHLGIGGDFVITNCQRGADKDGRLTYAFTAKPSDSTAYPVDFRVSSGA